MSKRIEELERLANERAREFMKLYMKVPDRKKAYRIYLEVAYGRLTYEQALRELERLARS